METKDGNGGGGPVPLFRAQIQRELDGVLGDEPHAFDVAANPATGEPRVTFVEKDLVGVCLSGGGIRSATFNLGVLQGLHRLGVLGGAHYLSTVSGGGYIGGWWSRWRARRIAENGETPGAPPSFPSSAPDAPEIRHLREFSNFLAPRLGLTEADTGYFAIGVLAASLPGILAAASLVFFGLWTYLGLAWLLSRSEPLPFLALVVPLTTLPILLEVMWSRRGSATADESRLGLFGALAAAAGVASWGVWRAAVAWHPEWRNVYDALVPGTAGDVSNVIAPHMPAVAMTAMALPFVFVRFFASRWMHRFEARALRALLDRAAARVLLVALLWGGATAVWQVGLLLYAGYIHWWVPSVSSLGAGGLFAWAWKRLTAEPNKPRSASMLQLLKPLLPQVLAYLSIGLAAACAALAIVASLGSPGMWLTALGPALVFVLTLVFFDPSEVSLHPSYRARIARAYLGSEHVAASEAAGGGELPSRYTEETATDDLPLDRLPSKPLHLVCCAANDIAGDRLRNLSRGARSAALSRQGFSIGTSCRAWSAEYPPPSYASALTASAAAFNSNMGSQSIALGKVVTFLMTALNLRLGLWLTHPRHPDRKAKFPGLLFFKEMLSLTYADRSALRVHLSDGGHFENLGLYELVRRHCRYILCSDCGQDPDVAFDDVGNALRRVRQDFGVEITIDLGALKPGPDGFSRQNVAVGTIDYGDADAGVLILLKPSLTGDEPDDVMQYRTRNVEFPHESTGDQFYDEAQWESYRRLGEHVAITALRVVDRLDESRRTPDRVFTGARWEWYPTPPELKDAQLELSKRCAALEEQVAARAPISFMRELYPELGVLAVNPPDEQKVRTQREWADVLELLLLEAQLLEDVWLASQLDTLANHPLNVGWVNYFQRWAATQSFRMWWPVLRPLASPGVQRFVDEHFSVKGAAGQVTGVLRHRKPDQRFYDLAWESWKNEGTAPDPKGKHFFCYDLSLAWGSEGRVAMQVGVAALTIDRKNGVASWKSTELYVPPRLWGAGIGTRVLRSLPVYFEANRRKLGVHTLRVQLDPIEPKSDEASRQERADLIQFYVGGGFRVERGVKSQLVRTLSEAKAPTKS